MIARACIVVAALGLCVAAARAEPIVPRDEAAATAQAGYGAVFGRVAVVEDGKERTDISLLFDEIFLRLVDPRAEALESMRLTGDGRFVWPLKPGEYIVSSFAYKRSTLRLWSSFTVPKAGQAVYIGDLRVLIEKGRFRAGLSDAYDEALAQASSRLAKSGFEPSKGLMQREPQIGSYRFVVPVCAKSWGIECNDRTQGAEALQPEGTAERYPTTTSLTPLLEWKPAGVPGIAYDVAIHDTFLTGPLEIPGASRDRGRLVAYAEGLKEPRFEPQTPLAPGKKYMWSVRFRSGETVSTWTTTSYLVVFIVGYKGARNLWYGFETPAASAREKP